MPMTEPDDTGCAIRPPTFIVEIDSGIDEWVRVLAPDEPMDGFEDESKAWALARKLHGTVQVRVRDIEHEPSMHPVGWSSTPPTKEGWYWARRIDDTERKARPVQVEMWHTLLAFMDGSSAEDADRVEGWDWFSEPIAEPPT